MSTARERLVQAGEQLKSTFVGRDEAIDCIMIALVTGANFILVGDPGTAKSALVRRAFSHVEKARQFSILCGSFATEDKVFGVPDIQAFKKGTWARVLKGRLADSELAFLDEVMKSNDGTLNSMLAALNEREYDGAAIPLWACGAATNWPEVRSRSETVGALWDRFLLRCRVDCLTDAKDRASMVEAAEAVRKYEPGCFVALEELAAAREEARAVAVNKTFVQSVVGVVERLRAEQVLVSDRRLASLIVIAQAAAWLDGRSEVSLDDIDALRFGLWNDEPHIPVVAAIMESVDAEVKKRCLKQIVEAQAGFQKNPQGDQAVTVMNVAVAAAKEVGPLLKNHATMRKATRAQVTKELDNLRAAFSALHSKLRPYLGGKDAAPSVDFEQKEEV